MLTHVTQCRHYAIDIAIMCQTLVICHCQKLIKTNYFFLCHQKILQHLPEKIYNRWQFHSIGMFLLHTFF